MKSIKTLIFSLIITQLAGIFGSFFTSTAIDSWYLTLNKPIFTPPNWLFAPAWITLFILMGISLYLVYVSDSKDRKSRGLFLKFFYIQLFLNFFWNVLFFGLQNPLLGLIGISLLIIAVVITIYYGLKVRRISSYLLIPYLLWLLFATALNIGILVLN